MTVKVKSYQQFFQVIYNAPTMLQISILGLSSFLRLSLLLRWVTVLEMGVSHLVIVGDGPGDGG